MPALAHPTLAEAEASFATTGDGGERVSLSRLFERLARHPEGPRVEIVRIELRCELGRPPSDRETWLEFAERHPVRARQVLEDARHFLRSEGRRDESDRLQSRASPRDLLAGSANCTPSESRQAIWELFEECYPRLARTARDRDTPRTARPAQNGQELER